MQAGSLSVKIRITTSLFVTAVVLSGCLMDEEKAETGDELLSDNELSGSVGDGPVISAAMRVMRNDGVVLVELESDANAGYNVTIRTKGKYYPLMIDARGGTDLVTNRAPDFVLLGAVRQPGTKTVANVNPISTLAIELTRDLPGGITKENLATAEGYVVNAMNHGLTGLATTGAMGSLIDNDNIAEVVRASESIGETVRRTRDLQLMFSRPSSGDTVMQSLGSDLIDGIVDGRGGPRVDARTAAIATVVAAQVLLESMQAELHVNDQDATAVMNAAISQVSESTPTTMIDELLATPGMLDATRIGLDACLAVAASSELQQLRDAFSGVQAGMDPMFVRSLIPDNYRQTLDAALQSIAGGSDAVVDTVNDVARDGATPAPENRAPNISGTPNTSVMVGNAYTFTPDASDPDSDTLTFSISGQPGWASFDMSTGELSGTPTVEATHNNIVISATDGQLTSSLPAFTITVTATPPPNSPPTISGTPPTQVNANSAYSFIPTASDPDNETLMFSISGEPVWANFNTSTGELSGTPTDVHVGVYSDIRITVADPSNATDQLNPFTITVNAVSLGSVTLNWTPPTQNEDGTTLTDLAGYRFYWGTTPGVYTNSETVANPGITSHVVNNLVPGTYEFVATSYNDSGVESVYSNPATKIVP